MLRTAKWTSRCYCLKYSFNARKCSNHAVPLVSDEADTSKVILRKHGAVMMIGLNRPEKKNAVDSEMMVLLRDAMVEFERDDSIRAGVLFGEGGSFCSGYDLHELANSKTLETAPFHFFHNNFTSKVLRKPLIAAVSGFAVGFGMDLALWCDLRIMEETAILGCLGKRFGMSMSESAVSRLYSMVGLSRAMDYLLTGRMIKFEELVKCGLANRTSGIGTAIGHAITVASDITKIPRTCVEVDRIKLLQAAFSHTAGLSKEIPSLPDDYPDKIKNNVVNGSKLFARGNGKHGKLISSHLWNQFDEKCSGMKE